MLKNIRVPHEVKHQQTSPVSLSMDRRVGLSSNISPWIVVCFSAQINLFADQRRSLLWRLFSLLVAAFESLFLDSDIRVIACGSGIPMPRTKQAAACFLIELAGAVKSHGSLRAAV